MRRRSDDWINATHILKVAGYDKPARTRILEREVQKGTHEKVQGGYGKYQGGSESMCFMPLVYAGLMLIALGTWIPLEEGRILAERNKVLDKLLPIFDFVPGDRSPPPAPKHATASSRPRAPRAVAGSKRKAAASKAARNGVLSTSVYGNVPDYEQMDVHGPESETPDNVTVASESIYMDEYDEAQYSGTGKRRRMDYEGNHMSQKEMEHRLWSEELLDYFMLDSTPPGTMNTMPQPPPSVDINLPIDDKSHCALHWAAAMGDLEVVKTLIRDYQASIDIVTKTGQTPLMRSVMFTNCYDKQNMERMALLLIRTVNMQDFDGNTVFHHIVLAAADKKKHACARYYIDTILNKMQEMLAPDHIESILNAQDAEGNTAITIAARNGARKCIRSFLGRHARVDISNHAGETADQFMRELRLNRQHQERATRRQESSSPFAAAATIDGAYDNSGIPFDPLIPHRNLGTPTATVPQSYKTPGALSLSTQALPQLMSKGRNLAQTLDEQLQTAQSDLEELERLTANRKAEIENLQKQSADLEAREAHSTAAADNSGVDEYNILVAEIASLHADIQYYLEIEQATTLQNSLDTTATSSPTSTPPDPAAGDKTVTTAELIVQSKQVVELMMQRKELADFVGAKMAESGFDPKSEEYKRLITGALGVREEDVAVLLPEMIAELEEWRGLEV